MTDEVHGSQESGPGNGSKSQFISMLVSQDGRMKSGVDSEPIEKAIGAHGAWKQRLTDAAEGRPSDLKVDVVRADDACAFSKWFYSLQSSARGTESGKKVHELHAHFHEVAAGVLELALAGRKEEAHAALKKGSQFAAASSKLTIAMMEWKRSLAS